MLTAHANIALTRTSFSFLTVQNVPSSLQRKIYAIYHRQKTREAENSSLLVS